jgi:hypothetical protein
MNSDSHTTLHSPVSILLLTLWASSPVKPSQTLSKLVKVSPTVQAETIRGQRSLSEANGG